jgi:hypothetical protein
LPSCRASAAVCRWLFVRVTPVCLMLAGLMRWSAGGLRVLWPR